MVEYMPWSGEVVGEALEALREGVFSMLDIELSGKCPYGCVYCETPYRDRGSLIDFGKVEGLLDSGFFKWVYICGIGEPTYDCNEEYLLRILASCKKNGARCSIFTNLSNLTERLIEYVEDGTLYLIIKYDSLDAGKIKSIYNPDDVDTHIKSLAKVYELVKVVDGKTNIAASIVPTVHNIDEIGLLIETCLEKGIYPLLGQLEYSGSAKGVFDTISLDDETLTALKNKVEDIMGGEYNIPLCPAVVAGLHISNENKITLDSRTGLSCHWFWLDEPIVNVFFDLNDLGDVRDVFNKIIEIRKAGYEDFLKIKNSFAGDVFGGCGGNKREIFDIYVELMEG